MRSVRRPALAGSLFALLGAAGCGMSGPGHGVASGMRPVTGTVIVEGQRDQTVLRESTVAFRSAGDSPVEARGAIEYDYDGKFELFTERKGGGKTEVLRGVPAGEYHVRIETPNPRAVPAKYRDFATSGWKFTVGSGDNHFALKIDAKK